MSVKPSRDGRRAEKESREGRLEAKDIDTKMLSQLVNRRSKPNQPKILLRQPAYKKQSHHGYP